MPPREPHTLRPIHISFDALARADGSARFGFGPPGSGPSALSSVNGPIEVRLAAENASEATLEVTARPLSNVPATDAKATAAVLRSLLAPSIILTNNPRTLIQIVTQALIGGSVAANANAVLAAMVNASSLALLDAGSIPMRGVVCAVSVGRRKTDADITVDPDHADGMLDAEGCFAFMFFKREEHMKAQCVWTNWRSLGPSGAFDVNITATARELALQAAEEVYESMFRSIEGKGHTQASASVEVKVEKVEDKSDSMEI